MGWGASRGAAVVCVVVVSAAACTPGAATAPLDTVPPLQSAIAYPCPPVGTPCAAEAQTLTGAGATFPAVLYAKWIAEYQARSGVRIDYRAIGSGSGIKSIIERTVAFGASDAPLTDKQLADARAPLLHVPMVMGAVVPIYNLPGITAQLRFTPELLSGIFLGRIDRWNDSRILAVNPGVTFPDAPILTVHRSDGSGTTYAFTDYLSRVDAEWRDRVGYSTSVQWPNGQGGNGNPGVAALVRGSPNTIGYVELIYALQSTIPYGSVRNASGNFIEPTLESTTAAAAGAVMDADLRTSIADPMGPQAYPIATFTWVLAYEHAADATMGIAIARYLWWAVHDGQSFAKDLGYAPLPPDVVRLAETQIRRIVVDRPARSR